MRQIFESLVILSQVVVARVAGDEQPVAAAKHEARVALAEHLFEPVCDFIPTFAKPGGGGAGDIAALEAAAMLLSVLLSTSLVKPVLARLAADDAAGPPSESLIVFKLGAIFDVCLTHIPLSETRKSFLIAYKRLERTIKVPLGEEPPLSAAMSKDLLLTCPVSRGVRGGACPCALPSTALSAPSLPGGRNRCAWPWPLLPRQRARAMPPPASTRWRARSRCPSG